MAPFDSIGTKRLDQDISQVRPTQIQLPQWDFRALVEITISINFRPISDRPPFMESRVCLDYFVVLIVPYFPTLIHDLHGLPFCPHIPLSLVQQSRFFQGFKTCFIM